jgi:hypothetical protein
MTALSRNTRLALGVVGVMWVVVGAPLATLLAMQASEVFDVGLFTPLPLAVVVWFLVVGFVGSGIVVMFVLATTDDRRAETACERGARQRRWQR